MGAEERVFLCVYILSLCFRVLCFDFSLSATNVIDTSYVKLVVRFRPMTPTTPDERYHGGSWKWGAVAGISLVVSHCTSVLPGRGQDLPVQSSGTYRVKPPDEG